MPSAKVMGAAARLRGVISRGLGAARAAIAPPASPEQLRGFGFSRGDQAIDLLTGDVVTIVRGYTRADLAAVPKPFDSTLTSTAMQLPARVSVVVYDVKYDDSLMTVARLAVDLMPLAQGATDRGGARA